jgi:transcription elongation factor GreA
MMETVYLSRDGYEKMRTELEALRKVKAELSAEIGEAASQGDLRENAAYTYAKEKQAMTLKRIDELEMRMRNSQITDTLTVDKSLARIGATVTLKTKDGGESVYTLVGADEADPVSGKISVSSPLAAGILGRKTGEKFKVTLPRGEKEFTLEKISY